MSVIDHLYRKLKNRKADDNYRSLELKPELIDFTSNDYLGLARNTELHQSILRKLQNMPNGSTGSRLLSGNSELTMETERFLADIFQTDQVLLFDSGYMANLAILSTVPQKGDTVLYDELAHACIKDGIRLSLAQKLSFKHNDLLDLKRKLKKATGNIYVAVESVYSMDGDQCPLLELVDLVIEFKAKIIVDEAHSTGIYGRNGAGLCDHLGLSDHIFARILTFGKAMGIHGAAIAGNDKLCHFLVNFARPFIYTTAPAPYAVIVAKTSFEYIVKHQRLQKKIKEKVSFFIEHYYARGLDKKLNRIRSDHPIQSILIPGNEKVKYISKSLQESGFDVRPILSPTVALGKERIRICIHTFNTKTEISGLVDRLATI